MLIASFSEFRKHFKNSLDLVTDNHDLLILHWQGGKSVVVVSMNETSYLVSASSNKASLDRAIQQFNNGKGQIRKLIETE